MLFLFPSSWALGSIWPVPGKLRSKMEIIEDKLAEGSQTTSLKINLQEDQMGDDLAFQFLS